LKGNIFELEVQEGKEYDAIVSVNNNIPIKMLLYALMPLIKHETVIYAVGVQHTPGRDFMYNLQLYGGFHFSKTVSYGGQDYIYSRLKRNGQDDCFLLPAYMVDCVPGHESILHNTEGMSASNVGSEDSNGVYHLNGKACIHRNFHDMPGNEEIVKYFETFDCMATTGSSPVNYLTSFGVFAGVFLKKGRSCEKFFSGKYCEQYSTIDILPRDSPYVKYIRKIGMTNFMKWSPPGSLKSFFETKLALEAVHSMVIGSQPREMFGGLV
jgi:hypothetical protein